MKLNRMKSRIGAFILGALALLWFLIRVIPKPSRAAYPCQRVAFPIASAFIIWVAGTLLSRSALRKAKTALSKGNRLKALMLSIFAVTLFIAAMFTVQMKDPVYGAMDYITLSHEAKRLHSKESEESAGSIVTPEATVAIVRSHKAKAEDITSDEIERMVRKAVEMAGGFNILINDGDVVVIKPNVVTSRAYGLAFPAEANGISTDYRVVQSVVNLVREKNPTGKIIMMEGSAVGKTRVNMTALGYNNITGLDSVIYLDENIVNWYDANSPTLVKVSLPSGKNMYSSANEYYLNRVYYEADVVISIPCLKTHFITGLTGSIKNVGIGGTPVEMYGAGTDAHGNVLPYRYMHIDHGDNSAQSTILDKWIHDFYLCRPVDYVIMDGLQGADYGPYPGANSNNKYLNDVQKNMRIILAGKDPLATDAIEALIMGFDPYLIGYLAYLAGDNAGCINPAFIRVKGTQVHEIKTDFEENMPGKVRKYSDFTPPQGVAVTSWNISDNEITVSLSPAQDIAKVEVSYDNDILDPIVVSNFTTFTLPFSVENPDINKIRVLVYDKYLNCTTLMLENGTGIDLPQVGVLKVYPNPASTTICFDLPENTGANWKLSIYSSVGCEVLAKELAGPGKQTIDISKFSSGAYIIKLASGNSLYIAKLIKD